MLKRLTDTAPYKFVRVELKQGCYLLLTYAEYALGLHRAKRERRRKQMKERMEKDDKTTIA